MKTKLRTLMVVSILMFVLLSSCLLEDIETIMNADSGEREEESMEQGETPAEEPGYSYITDPINKRPSHVNYDDGSGIDYLHREFIQMPINLTWGPDNRLYITDWAGRHVITVTKDGQMEDLGLWQTVRPFQEDGMRYIEFDAKGNMYIGTHGWVFRRTEQGILTPLPGVEGNPIGGIAFSPEDELFFTDRGAGVIKKWVPGQGSVVIADELSVCEDLIFGLDGSLYVTQTGMSYLKTVDLDTGEWTIIAENVCDHDPCFLAVDAEGDIWTRGLNELHQLAPDGTEKPFIVDGVTMPGGYFWSLSAAGIAFDDDGGIWMGSYNSRLSYLERINPGEEIEEFVSHTISGFESSDLAVDSGGNVYAADLVFGRIYRFTPEGTSQILVETDSHGRTALAVDQNDQLYAGFGWGEIATVDADGNTAHYANVKTQRMVFGADNVLYAVIGEPGEQKSVVAITGVDQVTPFVSEIEGKTFGTRSVHIVPALDKGLYLFTEENHSWFFIDFEGNGYRIAVIHNIPGHAPLAVAASRSREELYVLSGGGMYPLYRVRSDGMAIEIANQIWGDPWGAVVSPDGRWLYLAESGAIDKFDLEKLIPNP